jgi:Cytosol aminopeptidase family, catalytic domain
MLRTQVIAGKDLESHGFGGIYGVGKAAEHPPCFVLLSHLCPEAEDQRSVCIVGKGAFYLSVCCYVLRHVAVCCILLHYSRVHRVVLCLLK